MVAIVIKLVSLDLKFDIEIFFTNKNRMKLHQSNDNYRDFQLITSASNLFNFINLSGFYSGI